MAFKTAQTDAGSGAQPVRDCHNFRGHLPAILCGFDGPHRGCWLYPHDIHPSLRLLAQGESSRSCCFKSTHSINVDNFTLLSIIPACMAWSLCISCVITIVYMHVYMY